MGINFPSSPTIMTRGLRLGLEAKYTRSARGVVNTPKQHMAPPNNKLVEPKSSSRISSTEMSHPVVSFVHSEHSMTNACSPEALMSQEASSTKPTPSLVMG